MSDVTFYGFVLVHALEVAIILYLGVSLEKLERKVIRLGARVAVNEGKPR